MTDGLAQAAMERARGEVRLSVSRRGDRNAIADLAQAGCGRLLFPAVAADAMLEAVVVNIGGGLTGGDRFATGVEISAGAAATVTTQACEKIYRSSGEVAEVETRITVGTGARLHWVPQETILFDRARLRRRLEIDVAADARLIALEAVLLGRRASGETLTSGLFRDSWRVRRDGRLVFAEEAALDGAYAGRLSARATLAGAAGYATVLVCAPDAEAYLEAGRELLNEAAIEGGISTFDGLCVARLVGQDGASLRRAVVGLLRTLGCELPRVWHN